MKTYLLFLAVFTLSLEPCLTTTTKKTIFNDYCNLVKLLNRNYIQCERFSSFRDLVFNRQFNETIIIEEIYFYPKNCLEINDDLDLSKLLFARNIKLSFNSVASIDIFSKVFKNIRHYDNDEFSIRMSGGVINLYFNDRISIDAESERSLYNIHNLCSFSSSSITGATTSYELIENKNDYRCVVSRNHASEYLFSKLRLGSIQIDSVRNLELHKICPLLFYGSSFYRIYLTLYDGTALVAYRETDYSKFFSGLKYSRAFFSHSKEL